MTKHKWGVGDVVKLKPECGGGRWRYIIRELTIDPSEGAQPTYTIESHHGEVDCQVNEDQLEHLVAKVTLDGWNERPNDWREGATHWGQPPATPPIE